MRYFIFLFFVLPFQNLECVLHIQLDLPNKIQDCLDNSPSQINNSEKGLSKSIYPKYCMRHTCAKSLFLVYLKFKVPRVPVFFICSTLYADSQHLWIQRLPIRVLNGHWNSRRGRGQSWLRGNLPRGDQDHWPPGGNPQSHVFLLPTPRPPIHRPFAWTLMSLSSTQQSLFPVTSWQVNSGREESPGLTLKAPYQQIFRS